MQAGDVVTVLAPFSDVFPDHYVVAHVREDGTAGIIAPGFDDPRDFAPEFFNALHG